MPRTDIQHHTVNRLPVVAPADDPLLRPERENQPGPEDVTSRCVHCPGEIVITGITTMCGSCAARRDWLVICVRNQVFIRCRCGHEWHEPEISVADLEAKFTGTESVYRSLDEAVRSTGFDGLLAGIYYT